MDIRLSDITGPIRLALEDAAEKSAKRRLFVLKDEISCRTDCSGCCKRKIDITVAEALVIYKYLLGRGKWIEVRARALAHKDIAMTAQGMAWFKLNLACPILSAEKRCLAYAVRPAACSTHFVKSDPDLCEPWSTKKGEYQPVFMMDLFEEFAAKIAKIVDKHGVLQMAGPIPVALLTAEAIDTQNDLTVQQVIKMIRNELR